MTNHLKVQLSEQERSLIFEEGATTIAYGRRGLNWKGRLGYGAMVQKALYSLNRFYRQALIRKECYYGPFVGEFGHFLLHNLPFLVHLHKNGVKIHYCGMEIHAPFLVDESGKSIIHEWIPLRDFFAEAKPVANETALPADVEAEVNKFRTQAEKSTLPFLDLSLKDRYWFVFRNWQLNRKQGLYDLSKVYGTTKSRTCVIFPRKKGEASTSNNGGSWNYTEVAKRLSPYFENVYFVGHPSMSSAITDSGNVSLKVSANNIDTLRYCAEAQLIVTQHSGAVHLGTYVKTPVLIIFNGTPPIKGLIDTIRFRQNLTNRKLNYAFSLKEIENFVRQGNF